MSDGKDGVRVGIDVAPPTSTSMVNWLGTGKCARRAQTEKRGASANRSPALARLGSAERSGSEV